ncbi:glycosyltransferase family 39 protein [Pollutimonas sp. M17]|uniref:glycosyltransferase family 39 protein n=1 Tax=Pollutimonas sp. M17 TaxID=2962065 RepID=UPI0021F3DE86|nr:glycosyltransferase family 39 protein [Pollutimonas sp. M17]UYO92483.1 glycosyltransferase family 39 protein [Pollutimonas sp. M17]
MSTSTIGPVNEAASAGAARALNLQVFLFLLGMVALWTVFCGVSHRAPDLDGMEELVWASSLELGYYKHPPVPSWFMHVLTQVFGRPVWLTFFAGQLFSALALWFIWRLGCEFTTPRKALMAMLIVSTSIYFSLRGTIYNHNTVQLWSIAAATWLFYRALRHQRASSWLWLGAVSAIATMTKYSAVIQFTAFLCFMLRQGSFKDARNLKGLALALAAYLVVISPHVYWLAIHSFQPLRYADSSLDASGYLDAFKHIVDFTLDQLARLSPMLAVWLAWAWWNRRKARRTVYAVDAHLERKKYYASELSAWDRSFLLWVGLTPFVSTVLVSALLGTRLVASWGTTFFILFGFYALWRLSGDERHTLRRIAIAAIAIHVLMAAGYAIGRGPLAWYTGRDTRSMFPGSIISQQMDAVWRQHVSQVPLTLIASDTWLGGNIAIHLGPEAQVFINGRYEESPWLDRATALDCGALLVYSRRTRGEPDAQLQRLFEQARWQGTASTPWSSEKSPLIDLNWGIIPPTGKCVRP